MKRKLIYGIVAILIGIVFTTIDIAMAAVLLDDSINIKIDSFEDELNLWHEYNPFYFDAVVKDSYIEIRGINAVGVCTMYFVDMSDKKTKLKDRKIDFCDFKIYPWTNIITRKFGYEIEVYRWTIKEKELDQSNHIYDINARELEKDKYHIIIQKKVENSKRQ